MILNLASVAVRDFLDRLVFLFQLSHVAVKRGFEFSLCAAELSDRFSDRLA